MNTACTIKAHQGGLFSLVNLVLTCMDRGYEHVHVDWSNSLYGEEDLYPKLFKGRDGPEVWQMINKMVEECPQGYAFCGIQKEEWDTITEYPDQWLTYTNVHKLYTGYQSWRNRLHPHWQQMGVLPQFTEFAESFARAHFGAYNIGVLIRANTHAGEQVNGGTQPLFDYKDAIWNVLLPYAKVFLMCQDQESVDWLKSELPDAAIVTHPGAKRSPSRDIDRHLHEPQTHEDAMVCLEEMLLLTKCDVLIHPISNIATTALIANPTLKSIYLPA